MIFVTVGTHGDPFDRLIRAAEALARSGHQVVLQRGTSRVPAPSCEVQDFLTPEQMSRHIAAARIVVTHGGPASILEVPGVPIVVPRRAKYGEHVDDHQVRFVAHIHHRAHVLDDPADLIVAVARHPEFAANLGDSPPRRSAEFARDFGRMVDALVARRR